SAVTDYATQALADAAAGTADMGDIIRVTSDTKTTYSPDMGGDPMGTTISDSDLVNGYSIDGNGTWQRPQTQELWAIKDSGSSAYVECRLDRLGRLAVTIFAGSGAPYSVRTFYKDVQAISGPQIVGVTKDATHLRLWLNGEEIVAVNASVFTNVTSFDTLYFNGNTRTASSVVPVNGWRWYCPAFLVAEDWSFQGFRRAHDAIARYSGASPLDVPAQAFGFLTSGQSWWEGSVSISDSWTGADGWDGAVDPVNVTYGPEKNQISNENLPNVRCTRNQSNNEDIGPVLISLTNFGNLDSAGSHLTGSRETIEWGCFKHLIEDDGAFPVDWTIGSAGAGGATLSLLSAETSPAPLVQALKSKAAADITLYEELLQSVVTARDFHRERGQQYSVEVFFWTQGHSDTSNANYATEFLAYYDKLNAAIKRMTGQSNDVVCIVPQVNYSPNGGTNRANIGTAIDQQILDVVDSRGTRPIYCMGPVYQITSFIHSYLAGYRWIGEILGKVSKRILHDGSDWQPVRPSGLTRTTDQVDIDFYVPVGSLQFVDSNDNNIAARVNTDGVDTYGFDVWSDSASVTI
ncbi:MAG: hypothetical protein AAF511_12775, partial [Pseudomonadota bacterium]